MILNNNKNLFLVLFFFLTITTVSCGGRTARLYELFEKQLQSTIQNPKENGIYFGQVDFFGETIEMTITPSIRSSSSLSSHYSFQMSGLIKFECQKEQISFNYGSIYLVSNCVRDSLNSVDVALVSINYDQPANEINVLLQHKFVPISIKLHQVSQLPTKTQPNPTNITIQQVIEKRFVSTISQEADQVPTGIYNGTKTILGEALTFVLVFNNDNTTFNFTESGVFNNFCPLEPYTYSNGVIKVTDLSNPSDCLAKVIKSHHATLKSSTYDPKSDVVTLTLKIEFITVDFPLNHQNS